MKTILFLIIGGLVIWLLMLIYDLAIAEAVYLGFPKWKMEYIFWLSIAVKVLNEFFKEAKE